MSRAQLTSTVEQNTGGAVAPFVAGKNKIINGDFGIWARGTSIPQYGSSTYTADRWRHYRDGSGATVTVTQQTFTPGAAPVAGYEGQYFLRYNQSVAGSGGTYSTISQPIENVQTFAGQTITLSYWAKASTNLNITPNIVQNFGSGGSSSVYNGVSSIQNLTTSWQRFTATCVVPSISGKTVGSGSYLEFVLYLPVNSTFTIDLWGVQLESGPVATPFTTASNTVQGELSLCQRYYWRNNGDTFSQLGAGTNASTTAAYIQVSAPVTMRTIPTAIDYANLSVYDSASYPGVSAISFLGNQSSPKTFGINCTSTSLTQFRPVFLICNNNINGYLGFSAEL